MDSEPLDKHRGTSRPRTRLWFLLALFFGILVIIAFGIISELMFSSDDIVISDGIFKNLLQVYEINTVCGLADLLLENHFSFQSYHEDFEKQLPTEWNERMSILESKEKFWNELTDEQITSRQTLTAEAEIRLQKIEHRSKISYYTMIMKYFSISPNLEGEFVALYENMPWSLLWLKDKHPECTPLLEEKYG